MLVSPAVVIIIISNPHLRIFFLCFYRKRKEGRERGGKKNRLVAFHRLPDWGSNPQPRYVP